MNRKITREECVTIIANILRTKVCSRYETDVLNKAIEYLQNDTLQETIQEKTKSVKVIMYWIDGEGVKHVSEIRYHPSLTKAEEFVKNHNSLNGPTFAKIVSGDDV